MLLEQTVYTSVRNCNVVFGLVCKEEVFLFSFFFFNFYIWNIGYNVEKNCVRLQFMHQCFSAVEAVVF